ncbi:ABC transporter [Williamsia sp. Leaf354]|uniref:ABC transporter ATP-binding protein n=1 Tax=Williamsia sp. Leaf354 TaxID=1736349 RepID=UPI0006F4EE05|nr:ABC transporter ATP-binding protein [Williamsia sp. Leaf354]KQR98078.1 ABC transporter [Williamsia sp. Leaf354]
MTLEVRSLRVTYDGEVVIDDIDLDIGTVDAPVTALLGPSGCGKSTLIRAIAGIEPIAGGSVRFDGVDLAEIPTHRRDFGVVFQDGQLLPGRTVGQNIAYGLRARRWSRAATAERVAELLDLVGLDGLADRAVTELSGGQAQRVALARALAPRPRLLLLDEPLSSLDRRLRERLAVEIAEILRAAGTPAILVTHDHQEAAVIADRIAVMSEGRIVQSGAPETIWRRPVDEWVARFVGCTTVIGGHLVHDADSGSATVQTVLGTVALAERLLDAGSDTAGGEVVVGLRPRSVVVCGEERGVHAIVRSVAALPEEHLLSVALDDGSIVSAVSTLAVTVGETVGVAIDPDRVAVIG